MLKHFFNRLSQQLVDWCKIVQYVECGHLNMWNSDIRETQTAYHLHNNPKSSPVHSQVEVELTAEGSFLHHQSSLGHVTSSVVPDGPSGAGLLVIITPLSLRHKAIDITFPRLRRPHSSGLVLRAASRKMSWSDKFWWKTKCQRARRLFEPSLLSNLQSRSISIKSR